MTRWPALHNLVKQLTGSPSPLGVELTTPRDHAIDRAHCPVQGGTREMTTAKTGKPKVNNKVLLGDM